MSNRSRTPRRSSARRPSNSQFIQRLEERRLFAIETVGSFVVQAAPTAAAVTAGTLPADDWLNTVNSPVSVNDAMTSVPIIDQGFANINLNGSTPQVAITFTFAAGDLTNGAGDDLVLFDARFSSNSYSVTADGFGGSVAVAAGDLIDTGVDRAFFYGNSGGPFNANIMAAGIDLTDLGVASGASVTSITVTATSGEADLLGIGSLSEPGPTNAAPTVSDISATTAEDNVITFSAADFDAGFSDTDGDTLASIKITSLPTNGTLELSGAAVSVGQEILRADLGSLTYTPNVNYTGSDSFGYNGSDGAAYAATGANVNITVLTKAQKVAKIKALIDALPLNDGNKNALSVKLNLKGNNGDIGKVESLINQLEAFVQSGKLTSAQADPIIACANALLTSLTVGGG
jgi:hypothetical protein